MMDVFLTVIKVIPVLLPTMWILGAVTFFLTREKGKGTLPQVTGPFQRVTILVPCHNEAKTISQTIFALDKFAYPNFEVIAINDGSRDNTLDVLDRLATDRKWLRVVNLVQNRGKAAALSAGLMASQSEFVLCIDADSELHPNAANWMIRHFDSPDVAAVTGNPRVMNRGTLVGRIQVGEFSAIIGLIKRYQQMIGKLFSVSGVIVMFRKSALLDVGLWDTDTVTEDIGVSWKLQTKGWNLRYEPRAICDVLMPDTVKGLWKQRLRWAQGGFEVMRKHSYILTKPRNIRLKLLFVEYIFSVFWTFAFPAVITAGLILKDATGRPLLIEWMSPLIWGLFLTGALSLVQFLAGLLIHGRYERKMHHFTYWSVWYPFVYWVLNSMVLFVAIPKVLLSKKQKYSTWISPDRGGITYGN